MNNEDVAFLPLALNPTDEDSVQKSIEATVAHFGTIDVVVNNAGYGLAGALEELKDAEARTNFLHQCVWLIECNPECAALSTQSTIGGIYLTSHPLAFLLAPFPALAFTAPPSLGCMVLQNGLQKK